MATETSVLDGESPASDDSISSGILQRARVGDQRAFEQLVQVHSGLVYHWCRRSGLSPHDAEDVGQQVFLAVSRRLSEFRREKPNGSFRAWLRKITRNRLVDFFRDMSGRETACGGETSWDLPSVTFKEQELLGEENSADEMAILFEQAVSVIRSEFSEQDFQAFHQAVIEGASASEVATRLGISANSVYIAKSRILKRLRDEFGETLNDELS